MRGLGVTCRMVTGMPGLTELHVEGLEGAGGTEKTSTCVAGQGSSCVPQSFPPSPRRFLALRTERQRQARVAAVAPVPPPRTSRTLG